MKRATIFFKDIANIIVKHNYYDVSLFRFDFNLNLNVYNYRSFKVKFESLQFKIAFDYNFHISEFQDAIYYFAQMNTSESDNLVQEIVKPWLETTNKLELSTAEIIDDVLQDKFDYLTRRQKEMRVSDCLKDLGWKKVKKSSCNVWKR